MSEKDILLDRDDEKKPFLRYKHIISVLVLGFVIGFFGAWAKIMHFSWANYPLTVSMMVKVIAGICLIIKLITDKTSKNFLNK
ncbi:MAG: hypothetical protein U0U67_06825 [Chitinophagales bacterium]